ncbi:hypothetical protein B0F90DRAFT_1789283 [Multifurca ochricompacta]|uniref:Uncharacterized protein n=1 Tax=Multifurca ochricompacta TaxID=376703 RepID=A0AAD4LUM9_9AGAM|nr:hypothetical protein B0F90DRAFT_1789283 [Multifurca ochricompacta]
MTNDGPCATLDGIDPFIYLGLWAMRASHSTATLSPGGIRGLYGLRFMHRLNIFLSHFGPRAGWAPLFLCWFELLTLTLCICISLCNCVT